jgi:ribonuclease HII
MIIEAGPGNGNYEISLSWLKGALPFAAACTQLHIRGSARTQTKAAGLGCCQRIFLLQYRRKELLTELLSGFDAMPLVWPARGNKWTSIVAQIGVGSGLDTVVSQGERPREMAPVGLPHGARMTGMAVLVGIDEAGYGPILGPLVISSSAILLPHQLLSADLWQVLKRSVSDKRKHLAGRLLIADSKKAHNKSLGIRHLERTVLACLRCLGQQPATFGELLAALCPACLDGLAEYPWYEDANSQKVPADQEDLKIASAVLAGDMAANGARLRSLKSVCLDVRCYNRMVSNVKNKASVLFTAICQLIENAFESFAGEDLQIIIDRQGGRVRYRTSLQRMFPHMDLRILSETQERSSYELRADGKSMCLHFIVDGDEKFLPVSLASMVSKYLRELFMSSINRYFAGFCPGLRPTAGYWQDGLRFISDLKRNLPEVEYDTALLIRCR